MVGQNRQATGPALLVGLGQLFGVEVGVEIAFGWRSSLDLGDNGQAIRSEQGVAKATSWWTVHGLTCQVGDRSVVRSRGFTVTSNDAIEIRRHNRLQPLAADGAQNRELWTPCEKTGQRLAKHLHCIG